MPDSISFIAMNRFTVQPGKGEEFEAQWRERETFLKEVPGFIRFRLLRLDDTCYSSYSEWASEQAFTLWTTSDSFRKAHGQRMPEGVMAGPPKLECWHVVLEDA